MFARSLILLAFLFAFSGPGLVRAAADIPDAEDDNWLSIFDYQERESFSIYGPPLREDLKESQDNTQLYLDMVENFYEVSEDEDDFQFIVEAFSVPVDQFRPTSFRPDGGVEDDLFPDDPLPQAHKTTSRYVDGVRLSTLPGSPFTPRAMASVKLGDDTGGPRSLFADVKKDEAIAKETGKELPKEEADKKAADVADDKAKEADAGPAGKINAPPKAPLPNSDMETLHLLQQAVRDLGLQKELNFENNMNRQTTASMGEKKETSKPDEGKDATPAQTVAPAAEPSANAPAPAVTEGDKGKEPVSAGPATAPSPASPPAKATEAKKAAPVKSVKAIDKKKEKKKEAQKKKKEAPRKSKPAPVIKTAPLPAPAPAAPPAPPQPEFEAIPDYSMH